MEKHSPSPRKVLFASYAGVIAFTAISLLAPILWEKAARREQRKSVVH